MVAVVSCVIGFALGSTIRAGQPHEGPPNLESQLATAEKSSRAEGHPSTSDVSSMLEMLGRIEAEVSRLASAYERLVDHDGNSGEAPNAENALEVAFERVRTRELSLQALQTMGEERGVLAANLRLAKKRNYRDAQLELEDEIRTLDRQIQSVQAARDFNQLMSALTGPHDDYRHVIAR